jgi:hypothetical protein
LEKKKAKIIIGRFRKIRVFCTGRFLAGSVVKGLLDILFMLAVHRRYLKNMNVVLMSQNQELYQG